MHSNDRRVLQQIICGMSIGLLCSGSAATPRGEFANSDHVFWKCNLHYYWDIGSIPNVESAPGALGVEAFLPTLTSGSGDVDCIDCPPPVAGVASDSADLTERSLFEEVWPVSGCAVVDCGALGPSSSAYAKGSLLLTRGDFRVNTESVALDTKVFDSNCSETGECLELSLASAAASGSFQLVFSGPASSDFDIDFYVEADVWIRRCSQQDCGRGVPANALSATNTLDMSITALDSSGNAIGNWNEAGSFFTDTGDQIYQTGVFDSEDFVEQPDWEPFTYVSGEVQIPITIPTGTKSISITTTSLGLGSDPGDLDGDGKICWIARDALGAGWQSTVGDTTYDPRVDFNFDGYLDSDDLGLLNATACSADFNCDGVVDFYDNQEFQTAFSAQDSTADVNYDGAYDFYDIQMFLNAYSVGCP